MSILSLHDPIQGILTCCPRRLFFTNRKGGSERQKSRFLNDTIQGILFTPIVLPITSEAPKGLVASLELLRSIRQFGFEDDLHASEIDEYTTEEFAEKPADTTTAALSRKG